MHDLFFWPLLNHIAASGAFLAHLKYFWGVFFTLVPQSLFFSSFPPSFDMSELFHPVLSIDIKMQLRKH